jgi:hypothetical protein
MPKAYPARVRPQNTRLVVAVSIELTNQRSKVTSRGVLGTESRREPYAPAASAYAVRELIVLIANAALVETTEPRDRPPCEREHVRGVGFSFEVVPMEAGAANTPATLERPRDRVAKPRCPHRAHRSTDNIDTGVEQGRCRDIDIVGRNGRVGADPDERVGARSENRSIERRGHVSALIVDQSEARVAMRPFDRDPTRSIL